MKRIIALILMILMAFYTVFLCFAESSTVSHPFTDVVPKVFKNNADFYNKILNYVYSENIMVGTSESSFAPLAEVTRGMFMTVLMRAAHKELINSVDVDFASVANFPDVPLDSYYYEPIMLAKAIGLIVGDEYGNFHPEQIVTYEWAGVLLGRTLELYYGADREYISSKYIKILEEINNRYFTIDLKNISKWAVPDISYVCICYCYYRNNYLYDFYKWFFSEKGNKTDIFFDTGGLQYYPGINYQTVDFDYKAKLTRIDLANNVYFFRYYSIAHK